jgi:hypothetical protein
MGESMNEQDPYKSVTPQERAQLLEALRKWRERKAQGQCENPPAVVPAVQDADAIRAHGMGVRL